MAFIKKIEYLIGIADLETYQDFCLKNPNMKEICVVGRSNVGKSTFINMIAGRRIAKTSSTPGRTRLINIFSVNDGQFFLVDLPGYGYAEASKSEKKKWGELIETYLTSSTALAHVFSLVDIRHEPSKEDKQMIKYLYHYALPLTVIATKADKLPKTRIPQYVQKIATSLAVGRDNIIPASSETKLGLEKTDQKMREILAVEEDDENAE